MNPHEPSVLGIAMIVAGAAGCIAGAVVTHVVESQR
jgi:hypothetical protein